MSEQQPYIFNNLIEAGPVSRDQLGQPINKIELAEPIAQINAAGSIRPMAFEQVGVRASAFGNRFKKKADAIMAERQKA